jgi:acyl-CoA thioesterase
MQVLEAKDGYAKVSMKIKKIHTNALGFTHGGAIFSLADYAFAQACNFGDNVAVAVQVSINYLKPSVEDDNLIAEATRVSDGKTMGLYQVMVRKEEKTVALFTGLALKK